VPADAGDATEKAPVSVRITDEMTTNAFRALRTAPPFYRQLIEFRAVSGVPSIFLWAAQLIRKQGNAKDKNT
jgi:hypothetical protein